MVQACLNQRLNRHAASLHLRGLHVGDGDRAGLLRHGGRALAGGPFGALAAPAVRAYGGLKGGEREGEIEGSAKVRMEINCGRPVWQRLQSFLFDGQRTTTQKRANTRRGGDL